MMEKKIILSSVVIFSILCDFILIHYLHSLYYSPEILFWLANVAKITLILVSWHVEEKPRLTLLLILTSAFQLSMITFYRFGKFVGSDFMTELLVAKATYLTGKLFVIKNPYSASLSATSLPAIISCITLLESGLILRILSSVYVTLIVLISYLIFRLYNKERIAIFMLLPLLYHFLFPYWLSLHAKQAYATLLFLILSFCISYLTRKSKIILFLLITGIATGHYTIAILSIIIFIALRVYNVISNLLRKREENYFLKGVNNRILIVTIVISIVWLIYVAQHTAYYSTISILHLLQALSGRKMVIMYDPARKYIFKSSLGVLHTLIKWIIHLLMAYGLILAFKRKNNSEFIPMALVIGVLILIWLTLPQLGATLHADRIYAFGLPFLACYIALPLIVLKNDKLKIMLSLILFTMMIFEALYWPTIIYQPIKTSLLEKYRALIRDHIDESTIIWLNKHIEVSTISMPSFIFNTLVHLYKYYIVASSKDSHDIQSNLNECEATFSLKESKKQMTNHYFQIYALEISTLNSIEKSIADIIYMNGRYLIFRINQSV